MQSEPVHLAVMGWVAEIHLLSLSWRFCTFDHLIWCVGTIGSWGLAAGADSCNIILGSILISFLLVFLLLFWGEGSWNLDG